MKKLACCWLLLLQVVCYGQDLVVSGESGPSTWVRYTTFNHLCTVKNQGIVDIGVSWRVEVYISKDDQYSSDDAYFGSGGQTGLGGGQSVTINPYFAFRDPHFLGDTRGPVIAGSYYLVFRAIAYTGQETDLTNNTLAVPFTVSENDLDFSVSEFTLPKSSFTQSEEVTPALTINNAGAADVNTSVDADFYLSSDATYDNQDIFISSLPLRVEDSKVIHNSYNRAVTMPTVAPGPYYLITYVNSPRSNLVEINKSDNTAAQPITIVASDIDLEITNIDVYYHHSDWGSSVSANVTVVNNGTTGVTGYEFSWNLIKDNLPAYWIDKDDELSPYSGSNYYIGPGQSKIVNLYLTRLDEYSLAAGNYYLRTKINPDGDIKERTFTNNEKLSTATMFIWPPSNYSVTVNKLEAQSTYDDASQSMGFTLDLFNTGNVGPGSRGFNVIIKDEANAEVFRQLVYADVGDIHTSKTSSISVALTKPLSPGTYHVELQVYGLGSAYPSSGAWPELIIDAKRYNLTGTVQGEDGTAITKGNLFLYKRTESGAIMFIQRAKLTTANTFAMTIDKSPATLYFIPDSSVFKGYVPTVLGKTFMLQESSFFSATADMIVAFDVLKITPSTPGPGVINGRVATASENPDGRSGDDISPMDGATETYYRVLLLSASGNVAGYAITDAAGNFSFKDLPRAKYQLYITRELDKPQMTEPLAVDITTRNIAVNFTVGSDVSSDIETLMLSQNIQFHALAERRYGDAPVSLTASTDSGLPVTLASNDPSVAEIVEGQLVIKHAGKVTITASQPGDPFYDAAVQVTQPFTILKGLQTISFPEITGTSTHESTFALQATATSGLELTYTSDNENVATIAGNLVTVHLPGEANITATQPGNEDYEAAAPITRTLSAARVVGVENPLASLSFYPNPARDIVQFESAAAVQSLQLFNALGKAEATSWDGQRLDLGDLAPGVYVMKVYSGTTVGIFKIVKE